MNMKLGLFCLSLCFAAAFSMSIKDSTNERWENYKKNLHKTYTPEDQPIRKVMFNVTVNYPDDYDWRTQGYLAPVPNTGDCKRADWAFAAVGMLEGYLYKMDNKKMQLSVQDLIECSGDIYGNMGCLSGEVEAAYRYIEATGIASESSYPFNANVGKCKTDLQRDGIPKGKAIKLASLNPKEEGLMQWYISSKSPITAKISASKKFLLHKQEIFTGGNCDAEDNEDDDAGDYNVLIVGYGQTNSNKFWIVKNWMGENWGENGYAKVARNVSICNGDSDMFSSVVAIESINGKQLF